jgi:predicted esterase
MTTRIVRAGPAPAAARLTVVFVHGRGGAADDMLGLSDALALDDVAYVAPEAPGRTWYPLSFLAPLEKNEPYFSAALETLRGVIGDLAVDIPTARIAIMGFSQGACLGLEYAARHAAKYGAIIGFSGGLIGPPGTSREYAGTFGGTPAFVGCSDVDPHIPLERVHETTAVFRSMGAQVDERIYAGMGHTIIRDELDAATALLSPGALSR